MSERHALRDNILSSLEGVYMPLLKSNGGDLRPIAQWIADGLIAWHEKGRADERAAVVAWFRQGKGTASGSLGGILANSIERGDHVRAGGERGGEP